MSPFNLQQALDGAELITRDGHPVRVICFNRKSGKWPGKLIGLVLGKSGTYEQIVQYRENGEQINWCKNLDLMIKD